MPCRLQIFSATGVHILTRARGMPVQAAAMAHLPVGISLFCEAARYQLVRVVTRSQQVGFRRVLDSLLLVFTTTDVQLTRGEVDGLLARVGAALVVLLGEAEVKAAVGAERRIGKQMQLAVGVVDALLGTLYPLALLCALPSVKVASESPRQTPGALGRRMATFLNKLDVRHAALTLESSTVYATDDWSAMNADERIALAAVQHGVALGAEAEVIVYLPKSMPDKPEVPWRFLRLCLTDNLFLNMIASRSPSLAAVQKLASTFWTTVDERALLDPLIASPWPSDRDVVAYFVVRRDGTFNWATDRADENREGSDVRAHILVAQYHKLVARRTQAISDAGLDLHPYRDDEYVVSGHIYRNCAAILLWNSHVIFGEARRRGRPMLGALLMSSDAV